jgi:hypothetical protein
MDLRADGIDPPSNIKSMKNYYHQAAAELQQELLTNRIVFDIETMGAADEELVRSIHPPYPDFDPDGVKTGNCRIQAEIDEKIEKARAAHADQEVQYWAEKMEKRALSPETGRILTIGYLRASEPDAAAIIEDGRGDEALLIQRFWNGFEKLQVDRGKRIGWNSGAGMNVGFDLGYLIKRSWILGIPIPRGVTKGRFISDVFVDLMQEWGMHQFRAFAKLDVCSRVLGIGNKTDCQQCTGGQFAEWYLDTERREEAIRYAKLDLTLTRDIYLRLFTPNF